MVGRAHAAIQVGSAVALAESIASAKDGRLTFTRFEGSRSVVFGIGEAIQRADGATLST